MQLQSGPKRWLAGASPNLVFGVFLQRVHPAEANQTIAMPRHLLHRPVVFGTHLRVHILNRWTIRIAELIGGRQHHGVPDARRIEQPDQAVCIEARCRWCQRLRQRTEQVLMVIRRGPRRLPLCAQR